MVQSYSPGGGEGTLAPHGEYDTTCASFCLPESTTEKVN